MLETNINNLPPSVEEYNKLELNPVDRPGPLTGLPVSKTLINPTTGQEDVNIDALFADAYNNMPSFAKGPLGTALQGNTVSATPLSRYDRALGYTPFDPNLEDSYAREYTGLNFLRNGVGFATKLAGMAAASLSFIPVAIGAIGSDNYISTVLGDNDFSKGIHDWIKSVDENMPVYRTNYENDHPIAKYFNIFDTASLANTWSSQINQLGFTVGAIAGSVLETAILSAATGGVGFLPSLAKNAASFTTMIGRTSRLAATTPTVLRTGENIMNLGRTLKIAGQAANISTDIASDYAQINRLKSILTTNKNLNKIRNAAIYQTALISSASAEASFERAEVYDNAYNELVDKFRQENLRDPNIDEKEVLHNIAIDSANITAGANFAVLYLSNMLNWGALFKPTTQAIRGTAITGWGKGIARTSYSPTIGSAGKITYTVVKKTPESTLGKVFLNSYKAGSKLAKGLTEGLEEGAQFVISESATDYALRKYDPINRKEVVDYTTSMLKGLKDVFTTNEGLENIMGGFIGGLIGGGLLGRALKGKSISREALYQREASVLNENQLGDIFSAERITEEKLRILNNPTFKSQEGVESAIADLTERAFLAKEYNKAIKNGDIKKAKDLQDDMAFVYWANAKANNLLDARKEELDSVRHLEGDSFTDYWGMEYNETNVKKAHSFLDKQLAKADKISKAVDLVYGTFNRNPFNSKKNPYDYKAYESYKNTLSRVLYKTESISDRINEITEEVRKKAPFLDLQTGINLTTHKGLKTVANEISAEITNIQSDINALEATRTDENKYETDIRLNELKTAQYRLEEIREEVLYFTDASNRPDSPTFNGTMFLSTMRKLWDVKTRATMREISLSEDFINTVNSINSSTANQPLTDEELADTLEQLQDLYLLTRDKLEMQRSYELLREKKGETEFVKKHREALEQFVKNNTDEEGNFKIPQVAEDDTEVIRQEEYEGIDVPEEVTAEEKQHIIEASKKPQDEWTETEHEVVTKHKEVYDQFKEAEERVHKRIMDENNRALAEALGEFISIPTTASNSNITALKPETLLISIFTNPNYNVDAEESLYEIIFNHEGSYSDSLSAKLTFRGSFEYPNGITKDEKLILKEAAQYPRKLWTEEQQTKFNPIDTKYPGLIDNYTAGSYTNIKYNTPSNELKNSNLYRKDSVDVITIEYKGKVLGELRQPHTIYYKDTNNEYIRVFDSKGNLRLTPQQYSDFTGNPIGSYDSFKKETEAYNKAFYGLLEKVENEKSVKGSEIMSLFKLSINRGSMVQNQKNQTDSDTVLKDVKLKNHVVVTLDLTFDADDINTVLVAKLRDFVNTGSTEFTKEEVEKFLENPENQKAILKIVNGSRTVKVADKESISFQIALFPVNKIVTSNSIVRVRLINKDKGINTSNVKVSAPSTVYQRYALNFRGKDPSTPASSNLTNPANTASSSNPKLSSSLAPTEYVEYKRNGIYYLIKFRNDLERALFELRTNSSKNPHFASFINKYLRSTGQEVMRTEDLKKMSKSLVDFIDSKIDENPGLEHIEDVEEQFFTLGSATQKPYTINKESNSLIDQPEDVAKALRALEGEDHPLYEILKNEIKALGYKIANYKGSGYSIKPKEGIVYVGDDFVGVGINKEMTNDTMTKFGTESAVRLIREDSTTTANNVRNLWDVYNKIKNNPIPTQTSSSSQQSEEVSIEQTPTPQQEQVVDGITITDAINIVDNLNIPEAQKLALKSRVRVVIKNSAKRLGLTESEYLKRHRSAYIENPINNDTVRKVASLFFNDPNNTEGYEILNQPNTILELAFEKNPQIAKLNLDKNNIQHQWIVRFLTTTELGKSVLGRFGKNPTLNQIENAIQEELELIEEKANYTDDYYIQDLSDVFIEKQIEKANQESNSENASMWRSVLNNKQLLIEETKNLQKDNLLSIINYYKVAHEYPEAMKLMILDNILRINPSYDIQKDKYKAGSKRDNQTLGLHFKPSSLFMNKVIESGKSNNNIMHDYFYEAANYKGEKIDLSDYKDNVHQTTNNGVWYKFENSKEGDAEKFHKMSSLSSTYPGSWCTGGTQATADSYLQRGDMYIFYSDTENNPTLQLHVSKNNEGLEIGGLLGGQAVREQDFPDLDTFKNNNPSINLKTIEDYTKYSKLLAKWIKNDRNYDIINKGDLKFLLQVKPYYKDNTGNLDSFKTHIPLSKYAELFDTTVENVVYAKDITDVDLHKDLIIIGDYGCKLEEVSSKLFKHITGNVTFNKLKHATTKLFDSAGKDVNLNSLTEATTKLFDSAGGDVYLASLTEATAKLFDSAEGAVDLRSLNKATTKLFDSARGYIILNSLTEATTKLFDSAGGDVYLASLTEATAKLFDSAEGAVDLRSLNKATTKLFDSAGNDVNLSSLTEATTKLFDSAEGEVVLKFLNKATTKLFDSAGGNVYLDSLTEATTKLFDSAEGTAVLISLNKATTKLFDSARGYILLNSLIEATTKLFDSAGNDVNLSSLTEATTKLFDSADGDVYLTSSSEDIKELLGAVNNILNQDSRGAFVRKEDKSLTVFNKDSDITTIIHEKAHEYEQTLTEEELQSLEKWSGYKRDTVEFKEAFAKGAEKIIYDGVFGNEKIDNIFNRFKQWFKELIEDAIAYFSDLKEMNKDVLDIYAKMLLNEQEYSEYTNPQENLITVTDTNNNTYTVNEKDIIVNGTDIQTRHIWVDDNLVLLRSKSTDSLETTPAEDVTITEETVNPNRIKVSNKEQLIKMLTSPLFFNYYLDYATGIAEIYDMFIEAQEQITNKTKEQLYQELDFGNTELFEQLKRKREEDTLTLFFNKKEFTTIEQEFNDIFNSNKYDTVTTNLSKKMWSLTQTPTFKKWFGKSKVVDENGDPLIQWHWSPSKDITSFNLSGVGTHVGSLTAAMDIKDAKSKTGSYSDGKFYPLFIRMENPLLIEDIGQHHIGRYKRIIQQAFLAEGIVLDTTDLDFINLSDKNEHGLMTPKIKDLLNKYGFDGFMYNNLYEGQSEFEEFGEVSYIAVDRNQMKIVNAESFDRNSDNIYHQTGKRVTKKDVLKCL